MRASTAEAAVKAGASIINDVSGGLADVEMLQTAARLNVPFIAMHWRGQSKRYEFQGYLR
jgi:dihydropteroate synthase